MEAISTRLPRGLLPVPPWTGLDWPGGAPVSPDSWRGRVVILFLWDFAEVASLGVLPYLRAWHGRYENLGLSILGVLVPRFRFGQEALWLRRTLDQMGLPFPVAADRDLLLWEALGNHPIPSAYLADREGFLADCVFRRDPWPPFERSIQALLREGLRPMVLPPLIEPLRPEDQPGHRPRRVTPPVPFGYLQGRLGNPEGFAPEEVVRYQDSGSGRRGSAWLDGSFRNLPDAQEHAEGREARVRVDFEAASAWLVASPAREGLTCPVEVTQDGRPLLPDWRGEDVRDLDGATVLEVTQPGVWQVLRNPVVGAHRLVLKSLVPGLRLHRIEFTEHP